MDDKPDSKGLALEDAHVRTLNLRALLALSIIAVCVLIGIAALWFIPITLDSRHQSQTKNQFGHLLEAERQAIGKLSLEYSYWNEAVEKIIYERDTTWADSALGSYLHDSYGITNIQAESPDGEARYVYAPGESREGDFWKQASSDLKDMKQAALASDPSSPEVAHTFTVVDGTLYLLGITPFVAYQPTDLDPSQIHGVLLMARAVDESTLAAWSQRYGLTGLTLDTGEGEGTDNPEGNTAIAVRDAAGTPVARLTWQPTRLGRDMLLQATPWGVSVGILFLFATTVLIMNLGKLVRFARSNITELDQQKQKLYRQAMFDDVSNLHNRNYLISRLEEELSRIRRTGNSSIFIFLDLDGFKMINDTMGHSAGDDLLRQVGSRLVAAVRSEDVVCRFGGDEFCLLITGIEDGNANNAREVAEKISRQVISELEQPFTVDDKPVNIGASAGVVVIPDDTANIEDILRFGDLAMYKAKLVSGNMFIYYDRDFLHDINYRNAIRHKLEFAVPKKEFGLHYQPIHDMQTHRIVGFEALARWESDELGQIRPSQFIAIAEESDTIVRLGRWVIDEALRDARALEQVAGGRCFISINISGKQLMDPQFCEYLDERMSLYGVCADDIYLELTAGHEVCREPQGLDMLHEIRSRGIHLSLDDFGTGYASLNYLQQYPLSSVKVDQHFIANMMDDTKVKGIIRALVEMGESLDIRIVAEGVETKAQEQLLVELGCHWAQGYYYMEPKPMKSLTQNVSTARTDS